jgi:hypothetical protein
MELRLAQSQLTARPPLAVPACPALLARTSRLQSQPTSADAVMQMDR